MKSFKTFLENQNPDVIDYDVQGSKITIKGVKDLDGGDRENIGEYLYNQILRIWSEEHSKMEMKPFKSITIQF